VEVVRIVIADRNGLDTEQLDETVTVGRDANGKLAIERVSDSPVRPYGKAPEVIAVQANGNVIKIEFDSDLDRGTLAVGLAVRDSSGRAVAMQTAGSGREVDLTLPSSAAGKYTLSVLPALKDRDGRSPAAEWDLPLEVQPS
jgi:hypothetical protein